MTDLVIATPTFDKNVCVDYVGSLFATVQDLTQRGIAVEWHVVSGLQFIDLARNRAVHHFLHETNAENLLFIDADQGWDYQSIPRVLGYAQEIVVGLPPKKCDPPAFHSNAMTGVIAEGLFQSLEGGSGFMRIKRSAFAKLDAAYPELSDRENKEKPYFQSGIHKGGFLGEDMFFSRLWAGLGEFFWIDSDITFTHRGSRAWKGNFYEHAKATGLLRSA